MQKGHLNMSDRARLFCPVSKHAPFLISRLQPSDAQRTHCLALAIADILWRAGGREQAVVAL